ncbi:LysR family transcriptional regulator [Paracoccus alkanivorans]|uniref:LysR family transcriptional regulator n=1 Tax=Paracoccus alkanivorans TaxID=2116655 RepID=A0A3M0MI37_9RHOB|nr:LysR family transcriptional regulator [Paracoccus alkanivorans]RMC37239.1 LysR family transcriptional regulator [Paracoccus alkanivorans]
MDINQLRTFVTVVREGSITRASEILCRSQPAISAHIKSMEDSLEVKLFERNSRGMSVTRSGSRLLVVAEKLLEQHQRFLEEASRVRGSLTGELRIGAARCSCRDTVRRLLTELYSRFPELEVKLDRGPSASVLSGIRNGYLDAGFYVEPEEEQSDLTAIEITRFSVYLAGAPQYAERLRGGDLNVLQDVPCICPPDQSCYGRITDRFFAEHDFHPRRIIHVDDEAVTRKLIADGIGIGVVHAAAQPENGISVLSEVRQSVRILCGYLVERANDPVVGVIRSILNGGDDAPAPVRPKPKFGKLSTLVGGVR